MATNSADPGLLDHVANALDEHAEDIEAWGQAASHTMYGHGYAYGATATAGSTYTTAAQMRDWAASLRSRASLLAAYDHISLLGAGAAGGAGPALAAGRQWALAHEGTAPFDEWFAARMATLEQRRLGGGLAVSMQAALQDGDYAAMWQISHQLVALDSPEAAAGFFNRLGVTSTATLPNEMIGMTSMGNVYLRSSVGHAADLISLLSRQLASASQSGGLRFSGADLIQADLDADFLSSQYFTGYGAEYLLIAEGFQPQFIAAAVATYLPFHGNPVMAQQVLVSSIDGQLPIDPRDFLLPHAAANGAGAAVVLQLIDDDRLDALLNPRVSYDELGFTAVAPILEQATLDLFPTDPVAAQYVIGALIVAVGSGGSGGHLDIVAEALPLVMPQLNGVMNGASHQAWLGTPNDRDVLVTEDDLSAAFRRFATDDAAAAALYEGILQQYAALLATTEGDAAALNRIAISLGGVSSLLTTAVADANISEAGEKDARIAAVIGLIDTLSGLVPLPGATMIGSSFGVSVLKTTYGELVSRGLEVLGTNHESTAREAADAFNDALLFSYTEFLTLGYLRSRGAGAVEASIQDFFAHAPHLDQATYGFSDGSGNLLPQLTDRQTQAYGEWITFASADAEINDAISRMLAEFLRGLPHYDD